MQTKIDLLYADCHFAKSAALDAISTGAISRDGHFLVSFHDRLLDRDTDYHVLVVRGLAMAILHRKAISHLLGNSQPDTQDFAATWKQPAVRV